ncbi:MAG TPA: hypothetical protein ENH82_12415 [bacterium]|nr:hypothetical protein [bacterium]
MLLEIYGKVRRTPQTESRYKRLGTYNGAVDTLKIFEERGMQIGLLKYNGRIDGDVELFIPKDKRYNF